MSDGSGSTESVVKGETAGRVTVVGTAHISADSVETVTETIERERPDVVAVELDEGRYNQLQGHAPDDLEPSDLLRGNTVYQLLAYWLLSYVQHRLGERFDIKPGADMLAAVETAEDLGIDVALVDREIETTIQRFWARMTLSEKLRLVGELSLGIANPRRASLVIGAAIGGLVGIVVGSLIGPVILPPMAGGIGGVLAVLDGFLLGTGVGGSIGALVGLLLPMPEQAEVEDFDPAALTDGDVVTAMLEEFRRFSPGGAEALIDERDAFIAHRLIRLRESGLDVVAVVGAGHRDGIERYLANPSDLPPLSSVMGAASTRGIPWFKLVGWLASLGFVTFFALLAMAGVRNGFLLRLFAAWFLINGIFAFGLAKLAGARWTSASVGGAVAWMTSINPLLAPGWFAGYVELRYTPVNVGDITQLNELLSDENRSIRAVLADMREVPLFRLIVVVAATNIGSIVASALFGLVVLPAMAPQLGGVEAIPELMLEGARESAKVVWRVIT